MLAVSVWSERRVLRADLRVLSRGDFLADEPVWARLVSVGSQGWTSTGSESCCESVLYRHRCTSWKRGRPEYSCSDTGSETAPGQRLPGTRALWCLVQIVVSRRRKRWTLVLAGFTTQGPTLARSAHSGLV